jgi:hypothetical protein
VAKRDIEQQVFSPLVPRARGLAAVYIKHISGEEGGTNLKGLSARYATRRRSLILHPPCRKSDRGVIDEPPAPSNQSK